MYDFGKTLQVLSVAVHVRQKQPRYLTSLLTSALEHLRLVPDKHCPICVSSVVSPSALLRLITQSSTVADITYQIAGAFLQRKHGIQWLYMCDKINPDIWHYYWQRPSDTCALYLTSIVPSEKAVDCYVTLLNCLMTQWKQTFREIEICQCSMLLFVGVSVANNFQDTTFSI